MTSATLGASVIAVPPVARNVNLSWNAAANVQLIRYLEEGGVTTLLYGGNAALAHVAISEYADLLGILADSAAEKTVVIPSVGPTYGQMMDQGTILRDYPFPTVMLLPSRDSTTPIGIANGVRRFVDHIGRPIVLYLKHDGMLDVATIQRMVADGLIAWVKYGIARDNPRQDPLLVSLIEAIGPSLIVSGMGEQPAVTHLLDFGLVGFTSGCVCIAPRMSMNLLRAIHAKDLEEAERIRQLFVPLEKLRDAINPVRVLHAAVARADIAETGPITPFWSSVDELDQIAIQIAARNLQHMPS